MKRFLFLLLFFSYNLWADSVRVEVYPLSQNYWDTKAGESLSEIVQQLVPNNPYLQDRLFRDILASNPKAFVGGDPNRMVANKRLWLPNSIPQQPKVTDTKGYKVESYQWGSIKKPVR